MKTGGKPFVAALLATLLLGAASWWLRPQWYIGAVFPDFSELPSPVRQLTTDSQGLIHYPSSSPYDLDVLLATPEYAPTTAMGTLQLPNPADHAPPYPAMVLLHGSGGMKPGREMDYARWLADQGIAAFVVDYYQPRGVTSELHYMLSVLAVSEFDALSDAYHALKILRTHPLLDGKRIGVIGFSYGGMAARFAMDNRIRRAFLADSPGFRLHVDNYGPCFQNLRSASITQAPLLTLRGDRDASNELPACAQRENELRALGATVQAHVFQGAGHAWENTAPRLFQKNKPYVSGCEIHYDAQGRAYAGTQPVSAQESDSDRHTRIAYRLRSRNALGDCVKQGYLIGNDPHTKVEARKALKTFLEQYL